MIEREKNQEKRGSSIGWLSIERKKQNCLHCLLDNNKDNIKHNMLYQIIANNFARDMEAVMQQMTYTVIEAIAITNLNFTVPHGKPNHKTFFPDMGEFKHTFDLLNSRKKRSTDKEE